MIVIIGSSLKLQLMLSRKKWHPRYTVH